MITPHTLSTEMSELEQLLHDRAGVRGRDFAIKLRRTRRLLPRYARRAGQRIVSARAMMAHPRLARLVDHSGMQQDTKTLRDALHDIDPKDRRTDLLMSVLGSVVMNLLLLAALIFGVLWWRGVI